MDLAPGLTQIESAGNSADLTIARGPYRRAEAAHMASGILLENIPEGLFCLAGLGLYALDFARPSQGVLDIFYLNGPTLPDSRWSE